MNYPFMNTTILPPVQNQPITSAITPPRTEITKVASMESINSIPMGPNSSMICMDLNKPLIYVVVTDAASYKTVTPFTISEYQPEKPVDLTQLVARMDKLEERMNAYGQSYTKPSWSGKSPSNESGTNNANTQGRQ